MYGSVAFLERSQLRCRVSQARASAGSVGLQVLATRALALVVVSACAGSAAIASAATMISRKGFIGLGVLNASRSEILGD